MIRFPFASPLSILLFACLCALALASSPVLAEHAPAPPAAESEDDGDDGEDPGQNADGEEADGESDEDTDAEEGAEEEEEEYEGPFEKWEDVIEDTERLEGVVPVYRKREELYFELSGDHFENDYLLALTLARGIGARFTLGGLPLGTTVVNFRREGDHILLVEQNTRFVASEGEALSHAVELSFGESILRTFPIKSEHDSTGAIIVDAGGFLTSDHADLGFFLGQALDGSASLDGERTYVKGVKNFPENLEVDVQFTFNPGNRKDLDLDSVSDSRYIPLGVHYSLSLLPETDYVPRYADDRVGYFLTAQKDFASGNESGYFRRFVKRWNLEKKNPGKRVSEPVVPIVFYIDRTVPERYRKFVREGIEAWQPAFEEAGFEKAIVARDYPEDDPDFDPADVRYNTVRWITSNEPSFGAIGPSRMDPRTGQILDSDVLIEDVMVLSFENGYRRLVDTRALASATSFPAAFEDPVVSRLRESRAFDDELMQNLCTLGSGFGLSASLVGMSMLDAGLLKPGEPVPLEYVGQGLKWVVMHEVGHTLGLKHNFKSSTDTPYEKLHDKDWVKEHGLMSSVMDYAASNIALDPDEQGYYYGPGIGTYDRWAIRYGYTSFRAKSPDDEREQLAAIAAESSMPGHTYASDEDTYPSGTCDPMCNIFDLSDDPIANAERTYALTGRLLARPDLETVLLAEGDPLPKLRRATGSLLGARMGALTSAFKYLGGSYISRDHYGTPGARPAFQPVPGAEQRRALEFVLANAYEDDVFPIAPDVLDRLGPDRWIHWGNGSWQARSDYPLHDWVSTFHQVPMNALFSTTQLSRMQEAEHKWDDVVTMAELFDAFTTRLWRELNDGSTSISAFRRDGQRAHVDMLIAHALGRMDGAPADARALARMHLTRIGEAIDASAGGEPMDDYTSAHLGLMRSRIQQALDASLITEM